MPEEKKYYYIHLPKQAGSYIKGCVRENSNVFFLDELYPNNHDSIEPYKEAVRDPSCFLFTAVRNPFDLLVSYWSADFQSSLHRGSLPNCMGVPASEWQLINTLKSGCSFESFLKEFVSFSDSNSDNRGNHWWQHYQYNFLYFQIFDENGTCVIDHILRQENLEKEIEVFATQHGLSLDSNFHTKKYNTSYDRWAERPRSTPCPLKEKYQDYYTPETRELVEKHFKLELDIFGYTFDGPLSLEPIKTSEIKGPKWSKTTWEIIQ